MEAGKIKAKELPIPADTRKEYIRYAPGFGRVPLAEQVPPYTVDALAKFLGEVKKGTGEATESFRATFGALELIDGNGLKEGDIAGLQIWKIDAVVSHARKNIAAAKQAAKEAEERAQRQREALKKSQEEATRKAEADRIAAEKRAAKMKDEAERQRVLSEVAAAKKVLEQEARKAEDRKKEIEASAKKAAQVATKEAQRQTKKFASSLDGRKRKDVRAENQTREDAATEAIREKAARAFSTDDDDDDEEDTEQEKEWIRKIQKGQREAGEAAQRVWDREATIKAAMMAEAKELVSAGKKARATKLHPDHGGTSDGMQNLLAAAAWLLTLIEKEAA